MALTRIYHYLIPNIAIEAKAMISHAAVHFLRFIASRPPPNSYPPKHKQYLPKKRRREWSAIAGATRSICRSKKPSSVAEQEKFS
jgi:hypothetical protein